MKKYKVYDGITTINTNGERSNYFISTSRDALKHLRNTTANRVIICDMHDNPISGAERGADGKEYRITV